jgi:type III pantothenate kinase
MTGKQRYWLIDLGNSRLKCAAADAQGRRGEMMAVAYDQPNALAELLKQIPGDEEVWLASVASPDRTSEITKILQNATRPVHRIRTRLLCGKLRVAYQEAAQLGVDRFLGLLAAADRNDGPWVIVSAGSALTIDLLGVDGVHLGGMIVPMPGHMREALAQNFSQLDVPPGKAVEFAANTADAIATGARTAVIGAVERALRRACERLGTKPTLLLSGGNRDLLGAVDYSPVVDAPTLILDGIALFARGKEC